MAALMEFQLDRNIIAGFLGPTMHQASLVKHKMQTQRKFKLDVVSHARCPGTLSEQLICPPLELYHTLETFIQNGD